jgi:nitrogen fixation NifU-like protein
MERFMPYSDVVMDHIDRPRNVGWIEQNDAHATIGAPGRPPFMCMSFRLSDGCVQEVRYRSFGCGPAIAAGSVLTEMITGRAVRDCMEITEEQVSDALGGVPHEKKWSVRLALETMRNALNPRVVETSSSH